MTRLLVLCLLLTACDAAPAIGTAHAALTSQTCSCPGGDWGFGYDTHNGNPVLNLGYNVDESGNRVDPNEAAVYDSWEADYQGWVERHWQYAGDDGTPRRPLTMVIDKTSHAAQVHVGGKFVVSDETHAQPHLTILNSTGTTSVALDKAYIRSNDNNALLLTQAGSQGQTVGVANVDASDRVVVGGLNCAGVVVQSTGALTLPRLTTADRNALTGLVGGEVIFNTTTSALEYYDGTSWR